MSAGHDTLIGTWIGGYRIVRQLGQGAMGAVYLAEHPELGRKIAVKALLPAFAGHDKVVRRFFAEARSVSEINHPNIVQVHDFNRLPDGTYYLVMEYVEGVSLGALLAERGTLPLQLMVDILALVADALQGAHDKGVVHRDIKPDNIMVRLSGDRVAQVKLLDFGIAKLLRPGPEGDQTQLTVSGALIGTPRYMSPEQCRADGHLIGPATDLYSLGVIAYECLAGRPPFIGNTRIEYIVLHMQDIPPPLPDLSALYPGWRQVEQVVMRCLAKHPEERHPSAADLAAVLRELPARCGQPDITDLPTLSTSHPHPVALPPQDQEVTVVNGPDRTTHPMATATVDTLRSAPIDLSRRLAEQRRQSGWWPSLSAGERKAAAALFFVPSLLLGLLLMWLLRQ